MRWVADSIQLVSCCSCNCLEHFACPCPVITIYCLFQQSLPDIIIWHYHSYVIMVFIMATYCYVSHVINLWLIDWLIDWLKYVPFSVHVDRCWVWFGVGDRSSIFVHFDVKEPFSSWWRPRVTEQSITHSTILLVLMTDLDLGVLGLLCNHMPGHIWTVFNYSHSFVIAV